MEANNKNTGQEIEKHHGHLPGEKSTVDTRINSVPDYGKTGDKAAKESQTSDRRGMDDENIPPNTDETLGNP